MHQSRYLVILLILCFAFIIFQADSAEEKSTRIYSQEPEIVNTNISKVEPKPTNAPPKVDPLQGGPKPYWIWGANPNTRYFLRHQFTTQAKIGWLQASCDNQMSIKLNGKQVSSSSEWQSPIRMNISKYLNRGQNEIVAEVANQGGPSGFVCKIALIEEGKKKQTIISDKRWQASEKRGSTKWEAVKVHGKMGKGPWGNVFSQSPGLATANRGVFNVLPGFQVERLFTVPKAELGSWVSLTVDGKDRLLASDQGNKGICRITPPPLGSDKPTKVEHLPIKITSAQGMLWAFDSLYLSVNGGPGSGLYRARDTNGDDQFDEVRKLKDIRGGGEHGPHALRLSPDGKSIYLIAGNSTNPPAKFDHSRIPTNWSEDLLLPRQWDARGHARGRLAPGGWIAKTDPDGKTWEIISMGYRNPYDMDFNADGELFAYDADMEWDMGTPWYRPTRVVHATSGSEFGWRSGTGKWPTYFPDSLPPMVNVGPGSPVGVTFGYGTKFPAKYQKALFICDWTFGTMYAIHLVPDGASYNAVKEEFVSRTPLPLTDVTVGADGALYFTIGGRGTQSELFRVTYVGEGSTRPVNAVHEKYSDLRKLRQRLEQFHRPGKCSTKDEELIWSQLNHEDRFIRYAARIALEHREVKRWQQKVLNATDTDTLIQGAIALARQGEKAVQSQLIHSLSQLKLNALSERQQLDLIRAYSLVFIRLGKPNDDLANQLAKQFDAIYPAKSDDLNRELSRFLVFLKSPTVIQKTIALMKKESKPNQEDISQLLARNRGYGGSISKMLANMPDKQKIHYALVLRNFKEGWTQEQRKFYFSFLRKAREWSGGASFQGFIKNIGDEAFSNASDKERLALEALGLREPYRAKELPKPMGPGRDWTTMGILELWKTNASGRNFKNGERTFSAARCILCHRFGNEGGATGPDLTQVASRFSVKDLTEAMTEPSKVISDQYQASIVETTKGKTIVGQIVSRNSGVVTMVIDPENSEKIIEIPNGEIESITPSKISLMPADLMKPLNQEEVLDLLAYLLSRGNPRDPMFRK